MQLTEQLGQQDLVLRVGRRSHAREGYNQLDLSPQFSVVWVETGGGSVSYGEEQYHFQAGDAFKRLPGIKHHVFFEAGTRTRFLTFPAQVWDFLTDCQVLGAHWMVIHPGQGKWITDNFKRLEKRLSKAHGGERFRCMAAMQDFLAELHQSMQQADEAYAFLNKACDMLSLGDAYSVPEIAAACNMPYSTFRLRFQESIGCSPMAWRIKQRMQRAQELLLDQSLSISEIADELGYCDAFRFSKQFREQFGISPRTWRKSQL